jgi:zinc transport system substrate-binding protein
MNTKQKILLASIIIIVATVGIISLTVNKPQSTKLNVVTTFYPITYLTQEIGGDQIQVTQLVPSNTEIHSWEPSASHIVAAEDADIIIYNGAGADSWMQDDILPALSTSKTRIILDSSLGLELIANQEHEHEDETSEEGDGHEHGLYDPHTWISPYMAKQQAENIYNSLVQVDPQHESYYSQRWSNLQTQLSQLDNNYSETLRNATKDTIFVSHEAFGYLATRYGFEQQGVIGLSADEQPSATTIANLVKTMEENEIYAVYVDPVYSSEYAQTIQSEVQAQTGKPVTILELYLILGQTDGMDLLQQMQANLSNLKTGLEATY